MALLIATSVKPLADRVLVEPTERGERSTGGIVLPDSAKEKPQEGTVVAIGSGRLDDSGKRQPLEVKTGSKVLYAKYAGSDITLEGKDYLILSEKDILAIFE
jgi:chaperonin GroES